MSSISLFPNPETSILRFCSTPLLVDIVRQSGRSVLSLERELGVGEGTLRDILHRGKTAIHRDAYWLSLMLDADIDVLFVISKQSAALLARWENGQIMTVDGPNARFWSKVRRPSTDNPDACWEWDANRKNGYGQYHVNGRSPQIASRYAYELTFGPIPDGLGVLHRCDNPPCCNPMHLFLGTNLDNINDMLRKGRNRSGNVFKLTDEQVREIRRRRAPSRSEKQKVAAEFGISLRYLYQLLRGDARPDPTP